MAESQSAFVSKAGVFGTGNSVKESAAGFFDGLRMTVNALIPGGPISAEAAASVGVPRTKFPPNGDPIDAAKNGTGVDAAIVDKNAKPVVTPFSGISPWARMAIAAGALILLYKIAK